MTIGSVTAQQFITPGTFTYTPSANMQFVVVELCAAGAGAGGVASGISDAASGGGAGGNYVKFILQASDVGTSLSGFIGAGGAGGAAGNNDGSNGGNTTLATASPWTVYGGFGGKGCPGTSSGPLVALGGTSHGATILGTGVLETYAYGAPGGDGLSYPGGPGFNWAKAGDGGGSFYSPTQPGRFNATAGTSVSGSNQGLFGAGAPGSTTIVNSGHDQAGASGQSGQAIFTEFTT